MNSKTLNSDLSDCSHYKHDELIASFILKRHVQSSNIAPIMVHAVRTQKGQQNSYNYEALACTHPREVMMYAARVHIFA